MHVYVDEARCTGCGACMSRCSAGAIGVLEGVARIDPERCNACASCLEACPQGALLSVRDPEDLRLPALSSATEPVRSPRRSAVAQLAARVLPALGAAVAFVGREVLPVVTSMWPEAERQHPGQQTSTRPTRAVSDARLAASAEARAQRRTRHRHGQT